MAKKNGVKVLNRPFHPEMLTIGTPSQNTKKLHRGWIIQSPEEGGSASGRSRFRINFLYNPSQIVVSHSVAAELSGLDRSTINEQYHSVDHVASTLGQGTITIPLLFDRTYELWDRTWARKGPGKYGVYWDVLAFYHFTNLTGTSTKNSLDSDLAQLLLSPMELDTEVWANMYPINPMYPTFAYAYIGAFGGTTGGSRLKYYGQIRNLEVNYTHWSHKMVPMRCTVSVTMELLTDPNASGQRRKIDSTPNPATPAPPNTGNLTDFWGTGVPQ